MKERVARAVAVIMCFVLLLTSIDVTAYAFSGEKEDESEIVLDSLDEEAIIQGESPVEDIVFYEDVSANEIYKDETASMTEENREKDADEESIEEGISDLENTDIIYELTSSDENINDTEAVSSEAEFNKSVSVDGVVITVTAEAGVFPEGATIQARRVTTNEENAVEEAINEVRSEEKRNFK